MLRGLYTVSTVLEQNNRGINIMSNNLANIHSTGYKRDVAQYEEFHASLLSKVGGNQMVARVNDVKVDVAVKKDTQTLNTNAGYFKIDAPGGVSYNTSVELRVAEDGVLKTVYRNGYHKIINNAGYVVLGQKGPINVGDNDFEIDKKGQVLIDGEVIDRLIFNQPQHVIGTMSGGIKLNRIVSNFEQSALQHTENKLDFALNDRGFFTIQTSQGMRYTRNGQFKINADMHLVNHEGHLVVGLNGPIKLNDKNITVTKYGELVEGGLVVDKFKIVNPSNVERLKKIGTSLYRFDGDMVEEEPYKGEVVQGFLENSNVDSLKEMIQIMEVYRAYESAQRVVRSYDDTLGRAVNDIAKL